MNRLFQQGDVLLFEIEDIPKGTLDRAARAILAHGEATGHWHEAIGDGVALLEGGESERFLDAPNGAVVTHQEHKPITLPPGRYRVERVREFDHFEQDARFVQD